MLIASLVPLCFAILLIWLNTEYHRAESLRVSVETSYNRRIAQITLMSHIAAAETAQRGYLLTHNTDLLAPLQPALTAITAQLAAMDKIDGQPGTTTHRPPIRRDLAAMFVEMNATIAQSRNGDRASAVRSISTGRARGIMDQLAIEIRSEIDRETRVSNAREAQFLRQRAQLRNLIAVIVALVVIALAGLLLWLWRGAARRHKRILDAFEAARGTATFFDNTIGAVLILGPSGKIEAMNPAAVALLGYFVDVHDRRDIDTIVDIAPGEGSFHKRLGLIDGTLQRTQLPDQTIRDRLGREIAVDVAMGVLHAADGDRVVVSLRDISERKRLDRVKDELMSTVSHEIRAPLTSIIGSLGLLRTGMAGVLPESAARLVDIAENNSRRLIRLIDDMLDIDRIETGKLRVERGPIDLRDVIARACVGSEGLAHDLSIPLDCTTPDEVVMVSGDAGRLLQVVSNLVSNALRVAPSGSSVDLDVGIDDAGDARVTVADRGPGVPLAFRTRIFGRFERATRDDAAKGTGLGLAISREIITLHDGEIWFEDRPGGGTCFTFKLARLIGFDRSAGAAPRILICCDRAEVSEQLVAKLETDAYRCDVIGSTAEALAVIAEQEHAVALVDLDMPGGGGLDLARSARSDVAPSALPIILIATPTPADPVVPCDLIDLIERPDDYARLGTALVTGLARSDRDAPVVLHIAQDCDRLAAVAVVVAEIEPEARLLTVGTLDEAREVVASTAPDIVVLNLTDGRATDTMVLPLLIDADGRAIPTILFGQHEIPAPGLRSDGATLIGPPGAVPDLATTLRRVVPADAARRHAA